MNSIVPLSMVYALCLVGQNALPPAPKPARADTKEAIFAELSRTSELDLTGHPAPYGGLVLMLGFREGWNLNAVTDEPALAKQGIHLFEVHPYNELRAGGVSRRTSLRFVLDTVGAAYYVDDQRLVVTTKQIARVQWLSQLKAPQPAGLRSPSVAERRDTAFAAGFWHLDPDVWVEPLCSALADSDREVSFDSAYALGEFGPQAANAIGPLIGLLKSKDLTLREAAVFALGKIGPQATDRLLGLLNDTDSGIAVAGAKAFAVMGSVGKRAVPRLVEAAELHAEQVDVCDSISVAISMIDPTGAIPTLRKLLTALNADVRAFAANTIAEIGRPARSCGKDLLPLLTDPSTRVRIAAARALSQIDLPPDFPTKELEAATTDPNEHVKLWAKSAIHRIRRQN